MYEIQELNTLQQLQAIECDWVRLLASTEQASFFHTLAWLRVYWKHFGEGQQLRVLVIRQAEEVVGILPLVIRKESRKVGPVRVLTWPLADWGSFYGPLGNDPAMLLLEGLRHIKKTSRNWDLIDFRWMAKGSKLESATCDALRFSHLKAYTRLRDQTAVVDTTGTWEAYLATRTSKWRNNYRRWQKKLSERGEVAFERYRPQACGDPRWDLFDACIEVAQKSWQGASQDGTTLSHAEIREFLCDCHAVAAEQGCLDMNLLRLNGNLIAFAYNYVFDLRVFGLRVGYDPQYAKEGAGNLLYCHALEASFQGGDQLYDLGPGSLEAKKYFWTKVIDLVQYTHFRPGGLRAQALQWNGRLKGEFKTTPLPS